MLYLDKIGLWLICLALVYLQSISLNHLQASAQETKSGGSSFSSSASSQKGGSVSGFSKFRQNIEIARTNRLQQQQQQQQNIGQFSSSQETVSSNSFEQQRPVISEQQEEISSQQEDKTVYGAVDGVPGVDFPGYTSIPNTPFACSSVPFDPGMYADESTGCQVYHLCYQGRRESFLCGVGTVFNQAILSCDFWHSVECSKSSQFYNINKDFGKSSPELSNGRLQQQSQSQSSSKQQVSSVTDFRSTSLIAPVAPPPVRKSSSFSRTESFSSNSFASSAGKVSPPKQVSSSVASSFGSSGKTSIRREEARSSSFGRSLVSPGRRVQTGAANRAGQFMAASSTEVSSKQMPVGSSLIVVQADEMSDLARSKTQTKSSAGSSSQSSSGLADQQPSEPVDGMPTVNEVKSSAATNDDNNLWKPYFKGKTTSAGKKVDSQTSAPAEDVGSSTRPPIAEQEPSFSSNNAAKQTEAPTKSDSDDEQAKKSPPPPTQSPADQPSSSIESDVGTVPDTTTPASPAQSSSEEERPTIPSATPMDTPTTTTEPPPTTITITTTSTTTTPPTTAATESNPAETTTSKTSQVEYAETTTVADTSTTPIPTASKEEKAKRKRKRNSSANKKRSN